MSLACASVTGMDETTLTDHIESLDAIPAWVMDLYDGSDDLDLAALLKLVGSLDRARKALAETRDALGAKAAQLMDDKQAIVDGYGLFERRSAVKRVTDWDAILDRIATRSLYDADGEAVADPAIAVSRHEALVRSIIPLYRSTSAKQGGLSAAGIDKSDVQDDEWAIPNVTFKESLK